MHHRDKLVIARSDGHTQIVSWLYYNERADLLYKFMNNVSHKDRRLIIQEKLLPEPKTISNHNNEIVIANFIIYQE